jgi:hypothetical protein
LYDTAITAGTSHFITAKVGTVRTGGEIYSGVIQQSRGDVVEVWDSALLTIHMERKRKTKGRMEKEKERGGLRQEKKCFLRENVSNDMFQKYEAVEKKGAPMRCVPSCLGVLPWPSRSSQTLLSRRWCRARIEGM